MSHFGAAGCEPSLVFRGRALGGKTLLLGFALLAQAQLFRLSAPGRRHALAQFRHELAGQGSSDQTTQVGDRAGMDCIRLHPGAQFVEQGLGLLRAALNQEECRRTLFREQAFRQDQITTTILRPRYISDSYPRGWLLY
jgi:hypothetical protein